MKILDREIEYDFLDIENMKRYEKALDIYVEQIEEMKKFQGKDSEGAERICKIIYSFFDELIGQGTAIQILGEKPNYVKCLKAMKQIIEEKLKSEKEVNDILGKYDINDELIN